MEIQVKDVLSKINLLKSIDLSDNDKLSYAIKKTLSRIEKSLEAIQTPLNEKMDDFRVEHALLDDKQCFDLDAKGGYKFTKDNFNKIRNKQKELNNEFLESEITFEPFLVSDKETGRYKQLDNFIKDELEDYL